MEKILNIVLSSSGEVCGPLDAGFRGEHKATALVFTPDSGLTAQIEATVQEGFELTCRTDLAVASGEYFVGDERPLSMISDPVWLTAAMTLSGLGCVAVFRLMKKREGELVGELFKSQVKLFFKDSGLPYVSVTPKTNAPDQSEKLLKEFKEKVDEAADSLDRRVVAVADYASQSARQLTRVIALADELEEQVKELEDKLENGELDGEDGRDGADGRDGKDADLSLLSNALTGKVWGQSPRPSDVSPLLHKMRITLCKNLLAEGLVFDTDFGYAATSPFKVTSGKKYSYSVTTHSGKTTEVCFSGSGWLGESLPMFNFPASSGEFAPDVTLDEMIMYLGCAAEDVAAISVEEQGVDLSRVTLTVTDSRTNQEIVTMDGEPCEVEVLGPDVSVAADANLLLCCEYNRDLNKAVPSVDQAYNPESTNAQSGVAVAEGLRTKADAEKWDLIQDVTLTEAVATISLDVDCKKVYLEANLVVPTEAQSVSDYEVFFQPATKSGSSARLCMKTIATKNSTSVSVQGEASITPSGRITGMLNGSKDAYGYFIAPVTSTLSLNKPNQNGVMEMIKIQTNYAMQAGTTIKIWGVK